MRKKTCTKCLEPKKLSEFYKIHKGKHYMGECKACFKKRAKKNRDDNLERSRKKDREYYHNNKEKLSKIAKEWQQEHAEYMRLLALTRYYKIKLKKCGHPIEEERKVYNFYNKKSVKYLKDRLERIKKLWEKHKVKEKYSRRKDG